VQQYPTFGVVESASLDKLGGPTSRVAPSPVFAASENCSVDDADGVPADEELGGVAPVSGPRSSR
jgi:hypothetical protein